MTKVRLGVNPLFWMNSTFPTLEKQVPVSQGLSESALIGYSGVELEDAMRAPLNAHPQLLRQRGLSLVGGWHSCLLLENAFEEERQRLLEHIHFLKSFGSDLVILAECGHAVHRNEQTPLSQRPVLDPGQWHEFCVGIERLVEVCQDHGMKTAYHHHMGTVVQTEHDIDKLMRSTTHLGLLFDTGHLVYGGADIMRLWERHHARVTHIHLKNVRYTTLNQHLKKDSSFATAVTEGVFTVPGDNGPNDNDGLEFLPLFQAILQDDYSGWLIIEAEQHPERADPYTYARLGFATMQSLLLKSELIHSTKNQEPTTTNTELLTPLV